MMFSISLFVFCLIVYRLLFLFPGATGLEDFIFDPDRKLSQPCTPTTKCTAREPKIECSSLGICDCKTGYEFFPQHIYVLLHHVCLVSGGQPCEPDLLKNVGQDFYFDPVALDKRITKFCEHGSTSNKAKLLKKAKELVFDKTPSDWGCLSGTCTSGKCAEAVGTKKLNPLFVPEVMSPVLLLSSDYACPPITSTTNRTTSEGTTEVTVGSSVILISLSFSFFLGRIPFTLIIIG